MSQRELFFNAMRRNSGKYIPFEFVLCPSLVEDFFQKTGSKNYEDFYGFPVRTIFAEFKGSTNVYSRYFKEDVGISIDRWGVGHKKGSIAHFSEIIPPMKDFTNLKEFMDYPYMNPEDFDWEGFAKNVMKLKQRDLVVAAGDIEETVFETAWYLRGMENFLVDMVMDKELASYHMDRITEISCHFARHIAEAGCDILRLGDDVSTQLDMMISVELWREMLKPRLERVIKSAKNVNPEIMIFYHGDGNLEKIIPDLIETGVEILNPVQPECLDPYEVKRVFGDRLSLWGTLGTQTVMPFGTSDDVKTICKEMINKLGTNGGLLLAPTHMLEPEVPWENIEAFIETVVSHNSRC